MSTSVSFREASFQLNSEHFDAALAAIKATDGPKYPSLGKPLRDATTIKEALVEWCWEPTFNAAGDIEGLRFLGNSANDDEVLFAALAPFVTAHSWVEMQYDDGGSRFRYTFRGGKMREVYAEITWPEE